MKLRRNKGTKSDKSYISVNVFGVAVFVYKFQRDLSTFTSSDLIVT